MSVIDGGTFKCGNHDKEFVTSNNDEWQEHLRSHKEKGDLTKFGTGTCIVCNETIDYKDVPHHMNPMHDECKQALTGGAQPQQQGAKTKK